MSALLTISMMPVQAYARDTNSLVIDVTENGVTVNEEKADSSINKSDTDFDYVVINNGVEEEDTEVNGGQVEVSVGNVDYKDDNHEAAIEINNNFGDTINTDIQSGNITSSTDGIDICSDAGSVTASVGNIDAGEYGAYAGTDGGDATLTTGDIQAGGDGAYIGTEGGDVTLTAGSVQAQGRGIYIDGYADDTVKVSVGDIQAGKSGVYVDVIGGNTVVTTGGIDATEYGVDLVVKWAETDIKVKGNITGGEGRDEEYDFPLYGLSLVGLDGTNNIEVTGDVSGSMGMYVGTVSSETNMTINGSVSGSGKNIGYIPGVGIVYNYDKKEADDKLNMLVTDTISGSDNGVGIVTNDDGSDFTLTTWKITPSTDEFAVGKDVVAAKVVDFERYQFAENEEFEKSIQYIVKIDPAEVAGVNSLGATKEDGSALDKEGEYEWAHEGDTVLLKVELQDGYELANAYGKENQSYPFTKDASGNYYITVPRGGGIFISVETALKPVDPANPVNPVADVEVVDDEPSTGDPQTVQGMATDTVDPVTFNNSIIFMIANAVPGANITVAAAGNTMISKEVVDTFMARPEVSLTITYVIDGVMYSVTIPAGVDLNAYRNAAGGIDIYTLVQVFGAIVVG